MDTGTPLLAAQKQDQGESGFRTTWARFRTEQNKLSSFAIPMIVVSVSHYLLRAVPVMMLGHLSELALSSASVTNAITNVTGFSLIWGLACALETLCGQAYGAGHYQKVVTFVYGSNIWLLLACLPVCILWLYTDKLLILLGQDPLISVEAGKFCIWLIPSLFPFAFLQSLVRYLQVQSITLPILYSALASLILNVPISWALIFKFKLGYAGAALSTCFSYWLNVFALGLYVKYSSACNKTRAPYMNEMFSTFGEFFRFGIPSAAMACLEWWSFEIIILLGGLLPSPQLETSVLSICLTTSSLHFLIQYAFSAAVSTRVANELGAGKPQAAKFAVSSVMVLSVLEFVMASIAIFFCRDILGYIFSDEEKVIYYVKEITPFLCASIIVDSIHAVMSGVARGCGWQHIGAYVNLASYYLIGIPMALLLGFVLGLKGQGLWTGLIIGSGVQSLLLVLITYRTDWQKQAEEARSRIFVGKAPKSNYDELI